MRSFTPPPEPNCPFRHTVFILDLRVWWAKPATLLSPIRQVPKGSYLSRKLPRLSEHLFQVSRQSNRSLTRSLVFSCSSANDLEDKLAAFAAGFSSLSAVSRQQSPRPVILCFGGQVSTFVCLNRELFEHVKILGYHLDLCDTICESLGLESIHPDIFEKTPIRDSAKLQVMLFAVQYSCATSTIQWPGRCVSSASLYSALITALSHCNLGPGSPFSGRALWLTRSLHVELIDWARSLVGASRRLAPLHA